MFLLVGLGNPGPDYAHNRHNIGFMAVDAIHRRHRFGPWKSRFSAAVSEGVLGDVKTILVKPMTYMNESGRAVGDAARFHKIGLADILVIHDEIDLPPAKLRMKTGGGSGGHNGIRSLVAHLGDGFRRMRLGVGHPGTKAEVHGHVLRDFAKADAAWLAPLLDAIADNAQLLAEGKDATFANRVHLALAPAEEKEAPAAGKKNPPKAAIAGKSQAPGGPGNESDAQLPARVPDKPAGSDGPLARGLKVLFGRKA